MATKKKTEEQQEEKKPEEKIYTFEELFSMKFVDGYGNVVMIRKAYKPRGKLEFYQPRS